MSEKKKLLLAWVGILMSSAMIVYSVIKLIMINI